MIDEQKQPEPTSEHPEQTSTPSEQSGEDVHNAQAESDSPQQEAEVTPELSTEPEQEIEALKQEIANLQGQLEQQTQQNESLQSQSKRMAADFENFRRRSQGEKEELEQKVKQETILELLPVVDNFERARSQIKPDTDGEMSIHKSYQGVYKQLVDGLKSMGVSAMRPEGEEFDPNYHEAAMREPSEEYGEGEVIEQLVRGYLLGDRVLRHAMVKVAAPPEPVVGSEEQTSEPSDEEQTSEPSDQENYSG
ncbi:MAG: nucleotide exchange factor GrpE [Cyanobacteria bacterium QH_1_48_107]|jgi:molecular chaperone GrpE|nr:MAG: nucleotide exchange factor GrpE [Cyanobacteria bacterium QH_1_48_107]